MSLPLDIADPRRRGECPTLEVPMATGDGLLARIRVAGGRLSPDELKALARLAASHGNGLMEVTARGNLQVRGLTAASAPFFAEAVTGLIEVESGLVVDCSPLAGEDPEELDDPRPIAEAIRRGAEAFEGQLGPKVSVVVDGGGQIWLAGLKADVRLVATGRDRWVVTPGDGGEMDGGGAVRVALKMLRALAELGPAARATDLPQYRAETAPHPGPPHEGEGGGPVGVGWLRLSNGFSMPVSLPFGAADAGMLAALADAASAAGVQTIRLAPAHRLLMDNAPDGLIETASALGFITDPADARLRVNACIGSAGCASGHFPARAMALRLAPALPAGVSLHVSGCPKGCAHPRPADLTLVGTSAGYGLVIGGRAGDTPATMLAEGAIESAIASAGRQG
jgi:precorrin-3B synthase